jgi:hypothetical protein
MTAVMVPCLCTMSLAPLTCLTYTLILKSRVQCGRADAVGHARRSQSAESPQDVRPRPTTANASKRRNGRPER